MNVNNFFTEFWCRGELPNEAVLVGKSGNQKKIQHFLKNLFLQEKIEELTECFCSCKSEGVRREKMMERRKRGEWLGIIS